MSESGNEDKDTERLQEKMENLKNSKGKDQPSQADDAAEKGNAPERDFEISPIEKCVIDEQVGNDMVNFLATQGVQSGFLIGEYANGETAYVYAAVFPPHGRSTSEFDDSCMIPVRAFLEESGLGYLEPVAWVHSSPGSGFFLSAADRKTFSSLLKRDPDLLAVMVDPSTEEKVAVFANKSPAFEIKRIMLDRRDLAVAEEITFALNFLRIKTPASPMITRRQKRTAIWASISSLIKADEQLENRLGEAEKTINAIEENDVKVNDVEPMLLKECAECGTTYPSKQNYCNNCGSKLKPKEPQ